MEPGIFGWSLIFELLVFYYALTLLWPTFDRRWVYAGFGLIVLISVTDLTGHRWADVFSGHYDFLWTEIFENFGFR